MPFVKTELSMKEILVLHKFICEYWEEFDEFCEDFGVDAEKIREFSYINPEDLE